MTHLACKSKLRLSYVMSYMHPCPGNWVAIGHVVVYFARSAHAFSAGIKCQHCMCRHSTSALHARVAWLQYTPARPIANPFLGHGCKDVLTTERSFFLQPGTGRRPVDRCRISMSALYMYIQTPPISLDSLSRHLIVKQIKLLYRRY